MSYRDELLSHFRDRFPSTPCHRAKGLGFAVYSAGWRVYNLEEFERGLDVWNHRHDRDGMWGTPAHFVSTIVEDTSERAKAFIKRLHPGGVATPANDDSVADSNF